MHRSYNSYTPVASKLLQKRWDDRAYDRHRRHLHSSRPEIDSNPPITFMHLHLKLKKLQLEEERLATIERDNRILLEKMAHIMRTRGQIDNRNDVEFKSLSKGRRDREMLRIAKENVHMVKRIHSKKSELSVDKLERDWVQNLKFMDNISAFPEDWYLRKREERRHSDPAINDTGRSRSSSPRKSQRDKSKTAGKKRSDSRSDSDDEKSKEKSRPKEKKEEKKEEKKKEEPPSKIEAALKNTQKEDKKEEKKESKPAAAKETKKDKDEAAPSRMDSVFKNLQKDDSQTNRKDSKDTKTNKDRKESSPSSDKYNRSSKYEIEIKTSEESTNDVDMSLRLSVIGSEETEEFVLKEKESSAKKPFSRGNVDKFHLDGESVGKVKKIAIETSGSGTNEWKLDYVRILVDKQAYKFTASHKKADKRLELEPDDDDNSRSATPKKDYDDDFE